MQLDNPSNPTLGFNQQVQIAYKGNSNWPAFGTTKFLERVAIANRLYMDWVMDADILWNSLFATRTYGPINSSLSYDLDDDVFFLSDGVSILRTDGNTDNFRVVHPNARNDNNGNRGIVGSDYGMPLVYLTGSAAGTGSNLTLNFSQAFTAEQLGATIQVGVYTIPSTFSQATDNIVIDNPYWLVWATAAELARNDPSKQDQVPNLVGMANQAYSKMITLNQGNSFEQPNGPAYVLRNPGITWAVYGTG